ncbi:hypothetical protein AB0E85_02190 [Streptomyces sp. NPDC029044]|uniref:nSTAND1 domain-containing NTPase n=1 Tax=Streptomyces sp. NPDC029044 TaxID=3157198 RepID=UPI0033F95BA0
MGRREKPLDPEAGPVQRLAHELRGLREAAGKPTYRDMARRANYSTSALSAAAGGEHLPSLPVVLAYVRALDAEPGVWEERWRMAKAAAEEQAVGEAAETDGDAVPPYRGLARFEPYDRDLYFGRNALVGELLDLVRTHRFAAVFGPSGSGKSSLLRAGLVPALRDATGTDRPEVIRVLTPGERPADTHEKALVPQEGEQDTWVIVDQFEELFTLCRDPRERERFLRLLLAARDPDSRLRVVVAVRGDFYGHCAGDRELAEAVSRANLLVGPMDRAELREVVTKPAAAAGLLVERALTARIVDEVTGRPGALPMLSHALLETWRRRRGRTLTMAAYEAAGGVRGAIAATAEETYGDLSPDRARTARRVLLRLVAPGEGTADTRRPAERTEFTADAQDVLEQLAVARLVTLNDGVVELAHEALITGWPRLAGWIEEDREHLKEQRRLAGAARAWEQLGRDEGALYRGARLSRAEELFTGGSGGTGDEEEGGDDLTRPERAFLTASIAARDTATRKRRALAAALCVLLVLALTAGLAAWQQTRTSQAEAAKAAARRIAASAAGLRSSDPRTALLLGVAAWRTAPLTESRSALLGALFQPQRDAFTDPQTGRDTRRFLVDRGRRLVSVAGRRVSVWDVASGHRSASYLLPAAMEADAVSPDGRLLVVAGADGDERLWDLAGGKPAADTGEGSALAFTPDGTGLLTVPSNHTGSVRLHRTGDGKVLFGRAADPTAADLDRDGRLLALCPAGGAPEVWDTLRDERLPGGWDKEKDLCGTGTGADSGDHLLRFSPDGTRLAAASGDTARVWDISGGRLVADVGSTGTPGFTQLDFTPDGRFLATVDDRELAVWRLRESGLPAVRIPLTQGQEVRGLAWDKGRDRVLRFLDGATVRSYDLTANLAPPWQDTPADATVLSPDGSTLATATRSGPRTAGTYRLELRSTGTGDVLAHDTVGALPTGVEDTPLLSFSPDGTALAVSGTSPSGRQRVTVWDVAAHRARTSFDLPGTPENPAAPLALGPGGRILLIGHGTGTDVRDVGTGRRTRTLPGLTGATLAVRPDGRLLVGTLDQYARLPRGTTVGRALADGRTVTALAFSSDGERLAVGDDSGRVTLWDGDAEHRTGVLAGTAGEAARQEVAALAFSADGRTLAVGGTDSTLQVWDTTTQQLLGTDLPTPGDAIESVAFGGNDGTLYAAGPHTPLQRYTVDAGRAAAAVCARAGGGLTEAQWRTYVPDAPYREIC